MENDNFEKFAESMIREPEKTCKNAYFIHTYKYIEGEKKEDFEELSEEVGRVFEGKSLRLVFCVLLDCLENIMLDMSKRGDMSGLLSIFAAIRFWVNESFREHIGDKFWDIQERIMKDDLTDFLFQMTGQNN